MSERGERDPILSVVFYATVAGSEPVRNWLLELSREDRRAVGVDIKTAQHGRPIGMPLNRKLEPGLWEVRSRIDDGTARMLFTVEGDTGKTARRRMVDLHER